MPTFVFDTDHVSLYQRSATSDSPTDALVRDRVLMRPMQDIATTIVTVEEQIQGRLKYIRRADEASRVRAYRLLRVTWEFFQQMPLLDFDQTAHDKFRTFLDQKIRIGVHDLMIAAITVSQGCVLVTRNAKDFSKVPGLVFEDWST